MKNLVLVIGVALGLLGATTAEAIEIDTSGKMQFAFDRLFYRNLPQTILDALLRRDVPLADKAALVRRMAKDPELPTSQSNVLRMSEVLAYPGLARVVFDAWLTYRPELIDRPLITNDSLLRAALQVSRPIALDLFEHGAPKLRRANLNRLQTQKRLLEAALSALTGVNAVTPSPEAQEEIAQIAANTELMPLTIPTAFSLASHHDDRFRDWSETGAELLEVYIQLSERLADFNHPYAGRYARFLAASCATPAPNPTHALPAMIARIHQVVERTATPLEPDRSFERLLVAEFVPENAKAFFTLTYALTQLPSPEAATVVHVLSMEGSPYLEDAAGWKRIYAKYRLAQLPRMMRETYARAVEGAAQPQDQLLMEQCAATLQNALAAEVAALPEHPAKKPKP